MDDTPIDFYGQLRRQLLFARRKAAPAERQEGEWWVRRIEALRIERDATFDNQRVTHSGQETKPHLSLCPEAAPETTDTEETEND